MKNVSMYVLLGVILVSFAVIIILVTRTFSQQCVAGDVYDPVVKKCRTKCPDDVGWNDVKNQCEKCQAGESLDSQGHCVAGGFGWRINKAATDCTQPVGDKDPACCCKLSKNPPDNCYPDRASCLAVVHGKHRCNEDGQCTQDPTGKYASLADCRKVCKPKILGSTADYPVSITKGEVYLPGNCDALGLGLDQENGCYYCEGGSSTRERGNLDTNDTYTFGVAFKACVGDEGLKEDPAGDYNVKCSGYLTRGGTIQTENQSPDPGNPPIDPWRGPGTPPGKICRQFDPPSAEASQIVPGAPKCSCSGTIKDAKIYG